MSDGVDVLNFSIGGAPSTFLDPVEVAFLFAADAGVFVAASAGNSGPDNGTLDHPSPWLTTVGASTHNRPSVAVASVDGATYTGASSNQTPVPAKPVLAVRSSRPAASGWSWSTRARTRSTPTCTPCRRCTSTTWPAQRSRLRSRRPRSRRSARSIRRSARRRRRWPKFSSRGPNTASSADILKPDVTAPGVDVLAAVSPHAAGRAFDLLSGTSMSSPHVAGLAALLIDAHDDWSPMAVKRR